MKNTIVKSEPIQDVQDESNPEYLFNMTYTKLLVDAVNDKINLNKIALEELRKRGLDKSGNWIGF